MNVWIALLLATLCTPLAADEPEAANTALQVGQASWYGEPYHGRRTASGEIFNMHDLTAAHPSLPFGTLVRVTRTENRRAVVVCINDRGPFHPPRILDLSFAAAQQLDLITDGYGSVRLEILARERTPACGSSSPRQTKPDPQSSSGD